MSDPEPLADRERQADEVPLRRSLLMRTTVALGLGLALAALVLVLLFQPYLKSEFQDRSGALLSDQARRARNAAQADATDAGTWVRESVTQALTASSDAVADLPLELVTNNADGVRALADEQFAVLRTDSQGNLDALAAEISERTEARLRREAGRVAERNAERAEEFGAGTSRRAAALMISLLAALFLLHGALLYRSVLSPIRRLSQATRDVAHGDLETRLPVAGDDEVARLAGSFNAMTASLATAHSDLATLNAELEERVRKKTEELREKDRALRHAERMASLGTLAGGVAHEFNNLLGGILGCAEDAAREDDPDEMRATLAMIERTARRGTAITANLLRFARPGTGSMETVDVAHLLDDVAGLIEPEAVRLGVTVHVTRGAALQVRAEASGAHQVFLNLATNALHAMPDGGELTLSAEQRGDEIGVSVADTGRGIAAKDRERLFEPFFTTRPEGTGLGLSVSYGIVNAHGGRIEVESEPGHGATFRVWLPAADNGGRS